MQEKEIRIYGGSQTEFLDEVRKIFQEVVREALHSNSPTEDDQHPYTVQETAKFLNVCRQTVHEYVRLGKLKVHKIGKGRSYFMRADIMAALQSESYQRTPKASRHARR